MPTRTPQEIWETALGELQVQVSKPNYRTWFGKTTGLSYEDGTFTIGVPSTFVAEYLEKNQCSLIEKALIGLTSPGVSVAFRVKGQSRNNGNGNGKRPAASELTEPDPARTTLNPRYSFDSFVEGDSNRLAKAAALAVSQTPGHSYNPLFIYGGSGLGKTHLLHAIGRAALESHINVICTSAEQFTNEFVTALREKSTEEFRNKYRSIGMLLIDDIHFISGKEQTEESFFHTFNELHNTNRQIVVTSDCPPKSMPLLKERLCSRFEWGLIVDLQPPDHETRLNILAAKAVEKGTSLSPEVLELIAGQPHENIREMEGALNRVVAFARLLRAAPTLDVAEKALADIGNREPLADEITPSYIVSAVADGFQCSVDDLTGRRRDKNVALARRVAMSLIRQETNLSLVQVGRELGNRDAAAVTTSCKKFTEEMKSSPYLKRKVREIMRCIQPGNGAREAA